MKIYNVSLRPNANDLIVATLILVLVQSCVMTSGAQDRTRAERSRAEASSWGSVERATSRICEERLLDRQGTIPIDEMAVQRPIALNDPRVVAGKERAQRLLPVVRKLLPSVLNQLAADYQSGSIDRDRISARVTLVNIIKPDIDLHDNATVRAREPNAIIFGTVFLAGLRSDEAMVAVLAHELTHVADGPDHSLQTLFKRVATKAYQLSGTPIEISPALELTCELVGIQLLQEYLRGSSDLRQRLARALQKDCVTQDLADEAHLSPRDTLRFLLKLDTKLTRMIAGTPKYVQIKNNGVDY